jgi:ribosomal-protein-alanine N-acetyltransferase
MVDVTIEVRLVTPGDAEAVAELVTRHWDALGPWEPLRGPEHFTTAGQRALLSGLLDQHAAGAALPCAIVVDGSLAGRITLSGVVRGALQSASVGYWVSPDVQGRGVATAALRSVVATAFGELGLHRLQADTLVHNAASRRVLGRVGFVEYGLAPRYLRIAGRWQDCVVHQLLADDDAAGG